MEREPPTTLRHPGDPRSGRRVPPGGAVGWEAAPGRALGRLRPPTPRRGSAPRDRPAGWRVGVGAVPRGKGFGARPRERWARPWDRRRRSGSDRRRAAARRTRARRPRVAPGRRARPAPRGRCFRSRMPRRSPRSSATFRTSALRTRWWVCSPRSSAHRGCARGPQQGHRPPARVLLEFKDRASLERALTFDQRDLGAPPPRERRGGPPGAPRSRVRERRSAARGSPSGTTATAGPGATAEGSPSATPTDRATAAASAAAATAGARAEAGTRRRARAGEGGTAG